MGKAETSHTSHTHILSISQGGQWPLRQWKILGDLSKVRTHALPDDRRESLPLLFSSSRSSWGPGGSVVQYLGRDLRVASSILAHVRFIWLDNYNNGGYKVIRK